MLHLHNTLLNIDKVHNQIRKVPVTGAHGSIELADKCNIAVKRTRTRAAADEVPSSIEGNRAFVDVIGRETAQDLAGSGGRAREKDTPVCVEVDKKRIKFPCLPRMLHVGICMNLCRAMAAACDAVGAPLHHGVYGRILSVLGCEAHHRQFQVGDLADIGAS